VSEDADIVFERKVGFLVWTRTGHAPRFFHPTMASAIQEAKRLARLKPGAKFQVLKMVGKYHVAPPQPAPAEAACQDAG
jgi:hypothetical protein